MPKQGEWLRATLASIGDAVITTDTAANITFLSPVAQALTGWAQEQALGLPLAAVFNAVEESGRQPVESPAAKALRGDAAVGLAGHTLLIARDGTERPIDDSAAPIRNGQGAVLGVVLIFRDVSEGRRAQREAADALAHAEGIVDTVREPLLVLDAGLRVRTANRSFYRAFRASPEETEGQPFFDLQGGQWGPPRLQELLAEVLPLGRPFDDFEVSLELAGLGRRTVLFNGRRLDRRGDGPGLVLLAFEDVTERRRAAHALSVSEARYRRLFETAQDGILILDADSGRIDDANPFLLELLGYARAEVFGKELWEIGLFQDIQACQAAFRRLQAEGYIRYEDLPLQTRDGRRIDVEFVSNVYRVDDRRVIQCNIRDITDRKRAEEALRDAHDRLERRVEERTAELARVNAALQGEAAGHRRAEASRRELLRRLAVAQEEERHRLARELHDQMGQHLTALSLGLESLKGGAPEGPAARLRLEQLQELAGLMGQEMHRLALELRPTALDDLGLPAALANYVEAWSERAGLEADFHSTGLDGERLAPLLETALYRVVQEALTNVLKHARAERVSLVLRRSHDQVLLVVEDDGGGFDAEAALKAGASAGRLGLLGMQERLALVGGALTVESTPGGGTTVYARVPLRTGGGEGQP